MTRLLRYLDPRRMKTRMGATAALALFTLEALGTIFLAIFLISLPKWLALMIVMIVALALFAYVTRVMMRSVKREWSGEETRS